MIGSDSWIDWATRIDGVSDKVYSQPNSGAWITCHSVVGQEGEFEDGIPNRFFDTSRNADGSYTANAAASVMFVLRRNGQLIQMYPVTASTWTSGGREANTRSWAIEAEGGLASSPGGYSEPLSPAAVTTFVRLVGEWEAWSGKVARPGVTLLQHKDVASLFGYLPTACASDRYANAWAAVTARENDMTEDQVRTILQEEFRKQISDGNLITAGNFLQYLSLAFDPGAPNGFSGGLADVLGVPPKAVVNFIDELALQAADDVVADHCGL